MPCFPSLKNTTVHNPENDPIWEYETDWTRSACPICVRFHLMCACKHCNIKASVYYRTHWSCWWVYHFKKHRFHVIFLIKPRHTGRLIKQIWVEKPLVGALVTCGKTPTTVIWNEHLKIYCRLYCYAIKTKSTTTASKFCHLPLQAKDRTWTNCAVALYISGASRSQHCPDGPCAHLSGPAYTPSCIRPEVRLLLDQRIMCSDCCKKM